MIYIPLKSWWCCIQYLVLLDHFIMAPAGFDLLYPSHNEVVGGYIGFTPSVHMSICPSIRPSVRPSIRPASHVRSVVPTVLVGSISYLYILSSNSGISERRRSSCSSCISWWSRVSKTASWTSRICQSFYSHLYVTCFVKLQVLKIRQLVWGLDSGLCQTSSKPPW